MRSVDEARLFHDRVSLRIDRGVADVRLARPDKRNALDGTMFAALVDAIDALATSDAGAVILSGEGDDFCAGLDLAMFAEMKAGVPPSGIPADLVPRTHGASNLPQHCVMGWRSLPMPVIAAVHGAALGGGLQLALGADIRIVHPEARLALKEVGWGLVPDMGAFAILPRLMRDDQIRLLTYQAQTVDGREGVNLGLATMLADDPVARAWELALDLASKDTEALRAAKRLANHRPTGVEAILSAESVEQQAIIDRRLGRRLT